MTIETKFSKGDYVFVIENDDVKKMKITGVSYYDGAVNYNLLKSRACTSLDNDQYIDRREAECWATIDELASFYKQKIADTRAYNA